MESSNDTSYPHIPIAGLVCVEYIVSITTIIRLVIRVVPVSYGSIDTFPGMVTTLLPPGPPAEMSQLRKIAPDQRGIDEDSDVWHGQGRG